MDMHTEPMLGPIIARTFVIGSAIGIVLVFFGYTLLAVHGGATLASAAGIGAFTAFWGGLGFGGMMGAVMGAEAVEKQQQLDRRARTSAPVEEPAEEPAEQRAA